MTLHILLQMAEKRNELNSICKKMIGWRENKVSVLVCEGRGWIKEFATLMNASVKGLGGRHHYQLWLESHLMLPLRTISVRIKAEVQGVSVWRKGGGDITPA